MILDLEMELSAAGGQLFNATDTNSEYGSRPYDMQATGRDPAIGVPLDVFFQVVGADSDVGTSYVIAVVADTDGAGGSEAVVLSATYLAAVLTTALGVRRLGTINPGQVTSTLRYLTAKVTTNGTTPTAGLLKIWLQKATDSVPANAANII